MKMPKSHPPLRAGRDRAGKAQSKPTSVGFAREHEVIVRDQSDPAKALGTMRVGPKTRISMRPIRKGSREALEVIRRRLQRQRKQIRSEIWRHHADPLTRAEVGVVPYLQEQLEAVELRLSSPPQRVWRVCGTRIALPALCGSRPYFPAAP